MIRRNLFKIFLSVYLSFYILQRNVVFSSENNSSFYSSESWSSPFNLDANGYNQTLKSLVKFRLYNNESPLIVPSVANLSLESSELEFQEEFVEKTTPKLSKQVGTGILKPSYNPYDPLSTNFVPVSGLDTPLPRQDDGLDAFTARRVSPFSLGIGTKIRFADTVVQLGTSWDPQTSEFKPTLPGIFYFSFNAVTDRLTYFRISLQLNGADVVSAFGDLSGYQMAGNSALVRMTAGDRVYLTLQEGRIFDVSSSRAYTTFTGFRVL